MNETEVMQIVEDLFNGIDSSEMNGNVRVGAESVKKGTKLTFVTPTKEQLESIFTAKTVQNSNSVWFAFPTKEGREISIARLIRVGNGLPIEGITPEERIKSFVTLIVKNGGTLIVEVINVAETGRVFKNTRTNAEGKEEEVESKQTVWSFKVSK